MNRWVGLGVIADKVVNIGRAIKKEAASYVLGRSWRHHQVPHPPVVQAALAIQQAIDPHCRKRQFCAGKQLDPLGPFRPFCGRHGGAVLDQPQPFSRGTIAGRLAAP
jgi:hypothetical protein